MNMAENGNTKHTVVEEGTEIEGAIRSKCPITVSGAITGELAAPSLTVSSTGSVRGKVKVTELRSEGEIAGQIDAETVHLSGKVSDNTAIRASTLEVKLSQDGGKLNLTFGNVELNVGERPALAVPVAVPVAAAAAQVAAPAAAQVAAPAAAPEKKPDPKAKRTEA
jgi:cytoskeletal protein CcmA (bactofilin family)